jgi:hypothetical protein
MALAVLVPALVLSGCLSGNGNGDPPDVGFIQVTIEFGQYDPDTHPEKVALWTPDGDGGWEVRTEEAGDNGTLYIFFELNASTVLDALLTAADASGIEVRHHTEPMGAFVDSIDGVENGRDGHFWSYYLNGEYGTVGADQVDLDSGDKVRWVYLGSPVG